MGKMYNLATWSNQQMFSNEGNFSPRNEFEAGLFIKGKAKKQGFLHDAHDHT